MEKHNQQETILRIVITGVMAALICLITLIWIPLFSSKIQITNVICIFSGIWTGGLNGGIAAGIGVVLNDILQESKITFTQSKYKVHYIPIIQPNDK